MPTRRLFPADQNGPRSYRRTFTLVIVTMTLFDVVSGFVVPDAYALSSISSRTASSTERNMVMDNWQDFVFNAQSLASSWASSSLDSTAGAQASSGGINWVSSSVVMYGAGLLTSISPCVWGLLPLTISYISTAAGEREDKDTTLPTIAFAAGLAVVFCSLGFVAATVGGAVYGNSGTTSILLPLFSNIICLLMGLQLLEFIELPFLSFKATSSSSAASDSLFSAFTNENEKQPQPAAEQELLFFDDSGSVITLASQSDFEEKIANVGNYDQVQSLLKTFVLGGTSALVASPCATPVLTSILAFVADSNSSGSGNNPLAGVLLLFVYTLGYSTPLLIAGATGGQALVQLRELGTNNDGQDSNNEGVSVYAQIAPWISPLTAGILLWYGTTGLLTAFIGDPSVAGLRPLM